MRLLCLLCPLCVLWCRTLQDTVFQTYVSPEHYFMQIDPEAQGGRLAGGWGLAGWLPGWVGAGWLGGWGLAGWQAGLCA